MIPQRRLATLLDQAAMHQQNRCLYHNTPVNWRTWSLYADHRCDKDGFPRVTTAILDAHSDEVWNLQWSHNGEYLASAGKDQTAIIWRVGVRFIFSSGYDTRSAHRISFPLVFSSSQTEKDPSKREYSTAHILRDHPYAVGCVAWSPDDSILLTAADPVIKLWNVKVCICMCVIYVLLTLPSDWGVHEVSRCPHRCSNSARVAARRFRIHFRWTGPKNYLMGRQRHSLRNSIFP